MSSFFRKESYLSTSRLCPSCEKVFLNYFDNELHKCSHCEGYGYKKIGICRNCKINICERCVNEYSDTQEENVEHKTQKSNFLPSFNLLIALVLIPSSVFVYLFLSKEISAHVLAPIDKLRLFFPSQKTETWHHIFSILEMKFPTVKSLTLLHGQDDKTTECLVSKLIMLYTNDINIKTEDISFKNFNQEVKDYGEVLEYYRPIVEKHGILVTDLNKISGNIARIFHSLCDEGSSPIKPSLFIFILRYNEKARHLKPSKRATAILKEVWQDLPSNELFPLLSRVVKNVVDVIPEKQINC